MINLIINLLKPLFFWIKKYILRLYRLKFDPTFADTFQGENNLSLFQNLIDDRLKYASGRDVEIKMVTDFIKSDKSGILLIEGLSGFGKTTLIAKVKEFCEKEKLKFSWHFFSQLHTEFKKSSSYFFDNNIAEQIAYLNNDDIKEIKNKSSYIIHYFTQPVKNLIILIDGLDEEETSFLKTRLPLQFNNGLKIIVSSRTLNDDSIINNAGIFRDKVYDSLILEAFTKKDINQLLKKLNLSVLLSEKVYEISKGDPFYIRFLLQDISEKKLSIDELEEYPPSIDDYFEEQFQKLSINFDITLTSKIASQIILSPIPIPKSELIEIIDNLNNLNFNKNFSPIKRFFLSTNEGYIVCHIRFKEFFKKKINGT